MIPGAVPTPTDIANMRLLIAEPDDSNGYTDTLLAAKIAAGQTAATIWREKAIATSPARRVPYGERLDALAAAAAFFGTPPETLGGVV